MLTIVSDLFLTDSFLIKGEVEGKYTRLSHMLDECRRYFIRVRDATLVDLTTYDRIQTPYVHVNVDEILLAHELLDGANDPTAAQLAHVTEGPLHRVRVFYTGNLNMEVAGQIRPGSYEVDDRGTRRFFVMQKPEVRGIDVSGDEDMKLLGGLDYAILNKSRLSYVYDFNSL